MARSMDRRSFLGQSAAVAAGLAVAGSAGDLLTPGTAWAARTNGAGHNGISTARPKRGGSVVFGTTTEEQGFNANGGRFDNVGDMYARTVFDPLAIVTADGGWAPYLAKSITPNADYTAWTITLRPTVLFHDTTPCNGNALLANFESHANSALLSLALNPIVSTYKLTGPLSIQVNLKSPWIPFPFYLCGGAGGQAAYIMAMSMLGSSTARTDSPVGTGPFKFTRWVPNTHFTAVRNKKYWRKGLPYLDQITFKPIVDYTSRGEALASGTIDMMCTDTPQIITPYRGVKQWAYVDDSGPVPGEPTMDLFLLNLGKPPFTTATVRLAAAKALTRSAYTKLINTNVDPVSSGLFVKGTPFYSKTTYPSYDPAGARRILRKIEAKTGKPVTFTLGSTNGQAAERAATYAATKWRDVGFKVTKSVVQQNDLIDNALGGKFQCYEWRQFGAVDPDLNYLFWSTTTINPSLAINMARNNDPRVERALQTGRTNASPSVRAKAYQQVNEYFAQDLPYLFTDRATWAIVAHPSVQNFNNPTTPEGKKAYGMVGGAIWPTQIWRS
jgi:peptide/nickel transport system substrate-binding protein